MSGSSSSQLPHSDLQTILSVVQSYASHDALSGRVHPLHPYSSNPEIAIDMLRSLADTSTNILGSLTAHAALQLSNPKLLSLFRQQTSISHTVHNVSSLLIQLHSVDRESQIG